ncbi:hypothetical protein NC653_026512 [Populus alba x Populus x berolinensis]|uniref:Uncharacterized protein n=1 Tax=Populus alba x Populus x berolinensis TaxID=444605 RepID=A0AAD6QAD7_9ROSI|nr:hypothetical protein NC653_026512 [Populus alba x Populus x berolinensis]
MENVAKTSKFNQSRAEGSESSHEPKKKKLRQNNGNGDAVNTTAYVQVHPSDVFGPSIPGPIVFIVDCPTESLARVLLSSESLNGYYSNLSGNPPLSTKVVNCIIHLTPASVVSSPSYDKWIQKLYSAQHVMAGHAMKSNPKI